MHGDSGNGGGLVGALLSIALGTVIFVASLGTLIAIIFFGTTVITIGSSVLVLGNPEDATNAKIALAIGVYTGLLLLSFGFTYVITNDPGVAGIVLGSNGLVGVVTLLVGAAWAWARALAHGGSR